jgi:hypothetical protein
MKRRAVATYEAGPFFIVAYNDRGGWTVVRPTKNGQLRIYWPVAFRTLGAAYRAVEDHLGVVLTWRLRQ